MRQHLLIGQTSGLDLLVSVNPRSVAWALEAFSYIWRSLALLVVVPVFCAGTLESWIRRLFLANGLFVPSGVVYVYTMDALHPLALAALVVWSLTFPVGMGLLAALFRSAERAAIGAPAHVGN